MIIYSNSYCNPVNVCSIGAFIGCNFGLGISALVLDEEMDIEAICVSLCDNILLGTLHGGIIGLAVSAYINNNK